MKTISHIIISVTFYFTSAIIFDKAIREMIKSCWKRLLLEGIKYAFILKVVSLFSQKASQILIIEREKKVRMFAHLPFRKKQCPYFLNLI